MSSLTDHSFINHLFLFASAISSFLCREASHYLRLFHWLNFFSFLSLSFSLLFSCSLFAWNKQSVQASTRLMPSWLCHLKERKYMIELISHASTGYNWSEQRRSPVLQSACGLMPFLLVEVSSSLPVRRKVR